MKILVKNIWICILVLVLSLCLASGVNSTRSRIKRYISNGYSDVVQWDNYSLIVKGQRIFLQ